MPWETHPRILYRLAKFADFDDVEDGEVPDGWLEPTVGSSSYHQVNRNPGAWRRHRLDGDGYLAFMRATGDAAFEAGLEALLTDRARYWVPDVGEEVGVVFMANAADNFGAPVSGGTLTVTLVELDAGGSPLGGGTHTAALSVGPATWEAQELRFTAVGGATTCKLTFTPTTLDTHYWVDALHVGIALDFDGKRFRDLKLERRPGWASGSLGGVYEQTPISDNLQRFALELPKIGEALAILPELRAWLAEAELGGKFALWTDRSQHLRLRYHFAEACLDPKGYELEARQGPVLAFAGRVNIATPAEVRR